MGDIFGLLTPFYRTKWFFFIPGYKLKKTSCVKIVPIPILYQLLSLGAHLGAVAGFMVLYFQRQETLENSSKLAYVIIQGFSYSDMVLMVWTGILPKLLNKHYIDLINSLHRVEKNLGKLDGKLDYGKLRTIITIMLGLYLTILAVEVLILNYAEINSGIAIFKIFLSNVVVICTYSAPVALLLHQYCLFFITASLLELLGCTFEKLIEETNLLKTSLTILKLSGIYKEITLCVSRLNTISSVLFLFNFTRNLCLITMQIYSMVVICLNGEIHYATFTIFTFMILTYSYNVFICVLVCNECKKQLKRLKGATYRLFIKVQHEEIRRQLYAYALLLLHRTTTIAPLGMFKIDLQLLFAIVAAIYSYVILLVQFDMHADIFSLISKNRSEVNPY